MAGVKTASGAWTPLQSITSVTMRSIVVISEFGNSQQYTVQIQLTLSHEAHLSSLVFTGLPFNEGAFTTNTFFYSASVNSSVSTVGFSATTTDINAAVRSGLFGPATAQLIVSSASLVYGTVTNFFFNVTAQDTLT